jgi:Na/Pi-cotransporter
VSNLRILFAAISAIVLFLYGLEAFSREIQAVGRGTLRRSLGRLTDSRWRGVVLGIVATAIIQSSSAITSLTVALVDAGVITLRSSLGVLLGANIGTTSTAWLVSLKLTGIGPFFIVLGTVLSAIPIRLKMLGKAAFYFGFIFFSLDLVSLTLKPLAQSPLFAEILSRSSTPLTGVLAGMVLTAIVQSSSITTGLCILLVQQTILPATAAIFIVIGANIGTHSDCTCGQHQDAEHGEEGGNRKPLLQHLRRRVVPSVSRMVCSKVGRLCGRTRHGRGMGAADFQPRNDIGSADSAAFISQSGGTLRLHVVSCRKKYPIDISLQKGHHCCADSVLVLCQDPIDTDRINLLAHILLSCQADGHNQN